MANRLIQAQLTLIPTLINCLQYQSTVLLAVKLFRSTVTSILIPIMVTHTLVIIIYAL